MPFRYNPTTGIIIAHFSSRGKGLDLRGGTALVVWQGECRAKGADVAGPVRGVDIEQKSAGDILPRSCLVVWKTAFGSRVHRQEEVQLWEQNTRFLGRNC